MTTNRPPLQPAGHRAGFFLLALLPLLQGCAVCRAHRTACEIAGGVAAAIAVGEIAAHDFNHRAIGRPPDHEVCKATLVYDSAGILVCPPGASQP